MTLAAARLVVLVPALAAAVGLLVARRGLVPARLVAVGASVATLVVALAGLLSLGGSAGTSSGRILPGLDAGELEVPLLLQTGAVPALIAVVVAIVGWAVQAFAGWYLRDDDRYAVFAATVSLFCSGMLLVVHSADLVLTFVGWEVMGWCSYLLIGHWSRKATARRAALKAFLVTRFADVGFLLGVLALAAGPGSTAYPRVIAHWSAAEGSDALRGIAMVLLLMGILGKSAQVPFHDWLPDAMEGPTPASALIHAATMVAAGTFVLASLFDVFAASEGARWVLAVSTAVTMVWSAALAFGQSDLKRLLAYSTISQIALMLSALAAAPAQDGPGAGVFHLYSHAFFKALLFLALGWLSVIVGGTAAVAMRGGLRGHVLIRPAVFIGLLSLAGLPPLVGFVSKEHVIAAAEAGALEGEARSVLVFVALLATVALTAAYCMRAWLVMDDLTAAEPERHERDGASSPVRAAVVALAALTVVGGLVVFTPWLPLAGHIGWWMALVTVLLVVGAALAVRSAAGRPDAAGAPGDPAVRLVGAWMPEFDAGFGADRLYVRAVAVPVLALARLVVVLDRDVVDAYVRGSAAIALLSGRGGQRAHRAERSSTSLVWVVVGVVAVAAAGVALW
jgi:NADH-quinone oxidoreductase subunit L